MQFDQLKRREFITLVGSAAAWPLAARAQQSERTRRIGVLMGYAETDTAAQAQVATFRQELQKLGWEEGRNIRRSSKIARRVVQPDRDQVLLIEEPGNLKHANKEEDQQRWLCLLSSI